MYGVGFLNVLCMYPHAPNEHNYYLCHNIEAMATAFAAIILKEAKKTCSDYYQVSNILHSYFNYIHC